MLTLGLVVRIDSNASEGDPGGGIFAGEMWNDVKSHHTARRKPTALGGTWITADCSAETSFKSERGLSSIYDYCSKRHEEGPSSATEMARSVVITGQPGICVFLSSDCQNMNEGNGSIQRRSIVKKRML
jgi:hypothetical protein